MEHNYIIIYKEYVSDKFMCIYCKLYKIIYHFDNMTYYYDNNSLFIEISSADIDCDTRVIKNIIS